MLSIEFLAGFHQPVIQDTKISYCGIQMLMAQGLAEKFQRPSCVPAADRKISPQHVRCQFNSSLVLHSFQHVVYTFHLQGLTGSFSANIDEQIGLMLEQFSVFRQIVKQEGEGILADLTAPVFCILGPGLVLIIISEINLYGMAVVINISGVIDTEQLSNPEAGFAQQDQENSATSRMVAVSRPSAAS